MYFSEFSERFLNELRQNGLEVETREAVKVNETLTAIVLKENNKRFQACPYLEHLHEAFESGVSMERLLKDTAYIMEHVDLSLANVPEYLNEADKENLYCSLINKEMNQKLLEDIPHMDFEDLALIVRYRISQDASFIVKNRLCAEWKMTADELLQTARENTYKLECACIPINDLIRDMMLDNGISPEYIGDYLPSEHELCPMYVVSTPNRSNGAALMTSKDILDNVYERIGEHDFYILPSSIHEVIVVPEHVPVSVQDLKEMVEQVNRTQIRQSERLSNNVYHYNGRTHTLSSADSMDKNRTETLADKKTVSVHKGK